MHPFDEQYGVETGGMIWGEKLAADGMAQDPAYWATGYYGIAPSVFWQALDRLGLAWERTTFVDVGCGKGAGDDCWRRGIPFREVCGVELAPALAQIAERNLQSFRAEWRNEEVPTRVVCGDATTFPLPAGPLAVLLYHPFAAPVMRRFLEGMRLSLEWEPREIWLLYTNPELHGMLREMPWLEVMWDECLGMSEADRAADRFGSEWERIVAYRTVGAGGVSGKATRGWASLGHWRKAGDAWASARNGIFPESARSGESQVRREPGGCGSKV